MAVDNLDLKESLSSQSGIFKCLVISQKAKDTKVGLSFTSL